MVSVRTSMSDCERQLYTGDAPSERCRFLYLGRVSKAAAGMSLASILIGRFGVEPGHSSQPAPAKSARAQACTPLKMPQSVSSCDTERDSGRHPDATPTTNRASLSPLQSHHGRLG